MDTFHIFAAWTYLFYCLAAVNGNSDMRTQRQQKLEHLLRTLRNYSAPHREKIPSTTIAPITTTVSQSTTPLASNQTTTQSLVPINGDTNKNFYHLSFEKELAKSMVESKDLKRSRSSSDEISNSIDVGDYLKAREHYMRIRKEHKCKLPVPKLVRVKEYYPDSSRFYRPRCVSLHRCGDESGCCDNDGLHCAPSKVQEVVLYFYSWSIQGSGKATTVKLLFVNHTSCHCEPINDVPRMSGETLDDAVTSDDHNSPNQASEKCRDCPVPFTRRTYRDGRCGCDCFDREKICLRIKRGRQQLAEVERSCILANFCHVPDCEHGTFDVKTGFCPRRHDDVPQHRHQHHNRHHRPTISSRP